MIARAALVVAIFGAVLWIVPGRQPEREGGHHQDHAPPLDPFEKAGVTELTEGQRGRAFRLRLFPGPGRATLEDFAQNLIVLNFWATWCEPCTAEMPTLEALWQQHRERGLVVLGVSVDRRAPHAVIGPYVRSHGLTFPILLDPDMKTAGAWRVISLPATFIIKPGGEVAGMAAGAREWDSAEMRALLAPLLPAR